MFVQRCSVKKMLLKPTQNSQENTCTGVSEGLKACNFIKKRFQYRCFLVNFAKFLRTPLLKNICEPLPLHLKYCTPANNTEEPVAEYSETATA